MIRDTEEKQEKDCIQPGRIGDTDYRIRRPVVFSYQVTAYNPTRIQAVYSLRSADPEAMSPHIEATDASLAEVRSSLALALIQRYESLPRQGVSDDGIPEELADEIRTELEEYLMRSPFFNRAERLIERVLVGRH